MIDALSPALYVHIPFCQSRCGYCDFNTYAGLAALADEYVRAVAGEAAFWARASAPPGGPRSLVPSVYFGGGTPTTLAADHFALLLGALNGAFTLAGDAEITVEANPCRLSRRYLSALRHLGVNRLSLGVQSFDDGELRLLGRRHDARSAREAYLLAQQAGFANLSLDLIYGLPGQSLTAWQRSLDSAIALRPPHLSLYALSLEEGTPLARAVAAGRVPTPDPDCAADMYALAEERLAAAGYEHYEISNWAQPGRACRHNLVYWRRQPYLGLGAGAHSCFAGWRFANVPRPADYIRACAEAGNETPAAGDLFGAQAAPSLFPAFVSLAERVDGPHEAAERVILALRLAEGMDLQEIAAGYGQATASAYRHSLAMLASWGLLQAAGDRWQLTAHGRILSNQVFYRLLPEYHDSTPERGIDMTTQQASLVQTIIARTSFGIWDLLNTGADPFGAPVRQPWRAEDAIALLGRLGVPRVSLHDVDVGLDPWLVTDEDAFAARLAALKRALREAGLGVWMYTPSLFHNPLVRAGSLTANDVRVRQYSLRKVLTALDVAAEFGARWVTLWLGRDGAEVDALIDARLAYERIADALHVACAYIRQRGLAVKLSLEPKPNEPRGDIYVATVGTALGIIGLLPAADQELVAVNPELLQHESMAGLNSYHALGQLVAAGKLSFLHLGGQTPLRYDQDHPFLGGNSCLKASFYLALAIARHAPHCVLEFDCHPFRTEAGAAAREEFVLANLEALGMMMDKATRFLQLPAVQQILADVDGRGFGLAASPDEDLDAFLQELRARPLRAAELSAELNPQAQHLDRLVNRHLLGYL